VRRLALAGLVAVLVAGCGSHDSRTSYVKSLGTLCKDAGARIAKMPHPETRAELIASRREVNRIGRDFVRRLQLLSPGAPERAQARKLVSFYDAYWRAQPGLVQLLVGGQYNVYGRFQETASAYAKQAERIAEKLGANECVETPVR
jgi:hypothetical protein